MISVLVVDDSVVVRRLITDALGEDPEIEVVGTAPNGQIALTKIEQLKPDLVTLDIEMPVMDGIETLRAIRAACTPRLPVIMFSTLTAAGATATLDALSAGASDYVTKPANVGSVAESDPTASASRSSRGSRRCAPAPAALGAAGPPPIRIGPARPSTRRSAPATPPRRWPAPAATAARLDRPAGDRAAHGRAGAHRPRRRSRSSRSAARPAGRTR